MTEINLEALQNASVQAPLPTQITPCPEGEYTGMIEKIELRTMDTKNGPRAILGVSWSITDEGAKQATGRDPLIVRQDCWLDLNEAGNDLASDPAANVDLGRVRAAVNQNNEGPWQMGMLTGAGPAIVKVTHRTDEKTGNVYDEIRKVAKVG
jgi:hypothetical protein